MIDHVNRIDHLAGSIDVIMEDEKGLYFEALFSNSEHPTIEHARTVYSEGHAKGISIAGRFHYENVNAPSQLTLAEIYEISLVAIPADANSLAQVVNNGIAEVEKALSEASAAVKAVTDNLEVKKVVKEVQKQKPF
ncbi:phage head maturation protease [Elusimicrobium posterum]|uniref:HK97 family phage prohead protease n=1 Tax=Elusimicrobium posterum TaxID=3116653 RepID=UPI003C770BAE